MGVLVYAVDRPQLPPLQMPDRFLHEVAYFMTVPGDYGTPPLPLAPGHYWVRLEDARTWLDEFVVRVVSPLNSETKAEIELSEDQEAWLEWMVEHGIEQIRLERT